MDNLFLLLFLLSPVALLLGLIKPRVYAKIFKNKLSRKNISLVFGSSTILFFILFGTTVPPSISQQKEKVSENGQIQGATTEQVDNLVVSPSGKEVTEEPVNTQNQADNVTWYQVTRVVDGDTIDVMIDGASQRIRLIGIDTPESVDPRKPVECFSKEANNKATNILLNKNVKLEVDLTQGNKDKYGRLLRYVFFEGETHFNKMMIAEGYAFEYTYQSNPYKYRDEFIQAEKEARENQRGLWSPSTCSGVTKVKTTTPTPTQDTNTTNQTGCNIKGNVSSSGEKIYHVPGCQSYSRTKISESRGERWFCSDSEALNAGWRKALNCP